MVIVQRIVPHYRVAFFARLHDELAQHGIQLRLIYGQEAPGTVPRSVSIEAPWARRIANRYFGLGRTELVWQPCWSEVNASDLIIVEQANRLLLNYALLLQHRPALAVWGHGRNFQSQARRSPRELLKKYLAARAQWWFAYTDLSAKALGQSGVPSDRITVIENTIDTDSLIEARDRVSRGAVSEQRAALGIPEGAPVAVFCGGMHHGKELPFLLEAARVVRQRLPQFHLVLIGDGPEEDVVRRAASTQRWIHAVGAKYGEDRVLFLALGDMMLMPAHVGLAVIDSFIMQIPLFTTRSGNHSPEVAYIEHGLNGVISDFDAKSYGDMICAYFAAPAMLDVLRAGCQVSAQRYSLTNMVSRFAAGVRDALHRQR